MVGNVFARAGGERGSDREDSDPDEEEEEEERRVEEGGREPVTQTGRGMMKVSSRE